MARKTFAQMCSLIVFVVITMGFFAGIGINGAVKVLMVLDRGALSDFRAVRTADRTVRGYSLPQRAKAGRVLSPNFVDDLMLGED